MWASVIREKKERKKFEGKAKGHGREKIKIPVRKYIYMYI